MHTLPRSILLVVYGVVLVACSKPGDSLEDSEQPPRISQRVIDLMGGDEHADVIRYAENVIAYRIKIDPKQGFKEVQLCEGIELTGRQRRALTGLLVQDGAYEWEIAKGCQPMPGVMIAFEDGETRSELRLCFQCGIVEYLPGSHEDFDPVYAELVQWVKGVFHDDQAIQALGTTDQQDGL